MECQYNRLFDVHRFADRIWENGTYTCPWCWLVRSWLMERCSSLFLLGNAKLWFVYWRRWVTVQFASSATRYDPELVGCSHDNIDCIGRAECARSSGYMIKYNHSHFKMIPFGDIAIKSVPGIEEKLKDYFPRKQTITNHNLPGIFYSCKIFRIVTLRFSSYLPSSRFGETWRLSKR